MRISGPTLSQQDQMSVYDVAALTLGELANLINDIRVEVEQVQAAAAEAEARLASQQVELTDWILVADGIKHDWRCCHGEADTTMCLRCQLEAATASLASQGEQIAQLTKAITQWEERDEMLRQKVDDYQWDIGQLERQSTVLRQRTTELEADLAAALTARDEAERRNTWQPIESAPKDGTNVLLLGADGVDLGNWQDEVQPEIESGVTVNPGQDAGWYGYVGYWPGGEQPTLWMPLPSPPSDPSADPPKEQA